MEPKFKPGDRFIDKKFPKFNNLSGTILEVINCDIKPFYLVLYDSRNGSVLPGMLQNIDAIDNSKELDPKWILIKEFDQQLEDIING